MDYGCFEYFSTAVSGILMLNSRIVMYFSCFFENFRRSELICSPSMCFRGAQDPKKIKMTKNVPKLPQPIKKFNIKVFLVRTIGVEGHIKQFFFLNFWVFWVYFRDKVHYMSMLQNWFLSRNDVLWKYFKLSHLVDLPFRAKLKRLIPIFQPHVFLTFE